MGKFIVIMLASFFACGLLVHFLPVVRNQAFNVGSVGITWTMLAMLAFVYGGYKLSGK